MIIFIIIIDTNFEKKLQFILSPFSNKEIACNLWKWKPRKKKMTVIINDFLEVIDHNISHNKKGVISVNMENIKGYL